MNYTFALCKQRNNSTYMKILVCVFVVIYLMNMQLLTGQNMKIH